MPEKKKESDGEPGQRENIEKQTTDADKLLILDRVVELLSMEDVSESVKTYPADTDEMKTAIEFVNAHIEFITELVENDYKREIQRRDVEVKDIVANVNSMLKSRDEFLFTTMVLKSPIHYRHIQADLYKRSGKKIKSEDPSD